MTTKFSVAASLALAFAAAPLGAQVLPRDPGSTRTGSTARGRIETAQDVIDAARRRAGVYGDRGGVYGDRSTSHDKVPPGHLPPRGMCRIWIDGVPPGQQPAPTDCATAERNRTANSRVIYGDQQSFPGKGKGKFKRNRSTTGTIYGRDGTYERNGRIYDRNGRVIGTTNGGIYDGRVYGRDNDDDSDSDRSVSRGKGAGKSKAAKAHGKGKGKGRG